MFQVRPGVQSADIGQLVEHEPVLTFHASNMFACANAWLSAHRRMAGGSGSDGPPVSWTASTSGALASPTVQNMFTDATAVQSGARAQLETAVA